MKKKVNQIILGDTLEELKKFPDESIDCVVTSPPYWALRDYGTAKWRGGDKNCDHLAIATSGPNAQVVRRTGYDRPYKDVCGKCGAKRIDKQLGLEPTFQEYVTKLCNVFDEVKRVLKNTGTCWVNLGDTYSGGGNTNDRFQKQGRGKSVGEYKFNRKLNQIQDKCLCQIPFRFAVEMTNRGWILRNVIIWWKPNCMPSSIKDRFTVDFEYVFFFVKNKKYWFEKQYEPLQESSLLRAKYNSYSSKTNQGIHGGMNLKNQLKVFEKIKNGELQGRNKRCVWRIPTRPFKGSHFAVFPETLVETPIKSGCPEFVCRKCGKAREKVMETKRKYENYKHPHGRESRVFSAITKRWRSSYQFTGYTDCGCKAGFESGIVLDPFMGSGTTAVVAKRLGRNYLGIELNPKYIEMAEKRIKAVSTISRRENVKSRETGI